MQFDHPASVIGLTIQWGGITIVTILSSLMAQSVRRQFLAYWTLGWACLMLSLTSLLIALSLPFAPKVFFTVYILGAYAFAYLVVAGCRNYASGHRLTYYHCWALLPALLVAAFLPYLSDHFHVLMVPHTLILTGFWIAAQLALHPVRREKHRGAGLRILSLALLLLTVNFLQYTLVYAYAVLADCPLRFAYLEHSSLYDLLLETLLAFGTVIVVLESVCRQLEGEKHELTAASAQLQALAEQDPLTEALNRYAFSSFLQKSRQLPGQVVTGCVALVDMDDLKSINDTLGHPAGDAAIRAVARSIRSVIRADDLLFRWGGDEFLILLVGLAEEEARLRLARLNPALTNLLLNDSDLPIDLLVSYGVAAFDQAATLERMIEQADREMYRQKQARKAGGTITAISRRLGEVL